MTMKSSPPIEQQEDKEMLVPHQEFTEGPQPMEDTQHHFNGQESDCGFTSFMSLSEPSDPSRGYLVDDTCVIEAKVIDNLSYDSKKETGCVGLKKQGATDYLNSLLQTLYYIPYFRKAVYHMPTTENDMPSRSIPLALQSLFYKLQYSDNSVDTKELTKSFGWDVSDSFMPHDVQELNRLLCEKLEDMMKGTLVEGTIQHLFEGHHMNYIECINVNYKSARKESFYDLQLDVKGCRDVYASFDKYVGLQDAKKDVLFIDFPPVLQLQLKRFEYDFKRDTSVKLEDGDIIYYQKSLTSANRNQFPYPDVPSFLEYVCNLQNMDANLIAVSARRCLKHAGSASASVIPPLRNLQYDEFANNLLFMENKDSVVYITHFVAEEDALTLDVSQHFGAGFIWDKRGHIVTNYHVISGLSNLRVTLADETEYDAKVVGYVQDNDVAVLRIDAPEDKLWPIKSGISSNLLIGQKVYAIGHPYGLRYTLTAGIISGLRYRRDPANGQPILDAIQTDASINPGNSGGPLLDSSGHLIGIVKSIYSRIGESCGIGFAVPVDTVKGIVERFVKSGEVREAYIGGHGGSFAGDHKE